MDNNAYALLGAVLAIIGARRRHGEHQRAKQSNCPQEYPA